MTEIRIYPSSLPGEPLEIHKVQNGLTLGQWLKSKCGYEPGQAQPVSVTIDGEVIAPERWDDLTLAGQTVHIYPNMRGGLSFALIATILVASVAVAILLAPKIPKIGATASGRQGQNLLASDLTANQPRLNGVIPEIAGRYKVFPDYLCQPRRYFESPRTQVVEALLCVGMGEYDIDPDEIYIGETPVADLPDSIEYELFSPNADISANDAHRNWFNSREVGQSTGSSGLRLTSGASGTSAANLTSYRIDGDSITAPSGSGVMPQDWEVGNIVNIVTFIREITVVDGGGVEPTLNRDKVRGSFGDLGLAVSDQLLIVGSVNNGRYRVHSINTSVSEPGSPSTVTGVRVPELNYAAMPVEFEINGQTVILDQDFSDTTALVFEIDSQVGGVTISENSFGEVVITEDSPYSGLPISLTGFYDMVFGSNPSETTGAETDSFDELELDVWETRVESDPEGNITVIEGFVPAVSMIAGTYSGVDVQKPRIRTVTSPGAPSVDVITNTEYRITSLITGTLPDTTTGTVGFEFQRLDSDGTDDVAWTGFPIDVITPSVTMTLDKSQLVGGWLGPFRATPGDEFARYFEFDIFLPQGLTYVNPQNGSTNQITREFELQWRTNGGTWNQINYAVTNATRDQIGYTYQVDMGSSVPFVDVRIRRKGPESTDVQTLDRLEWYGLRSLLNSPTSYAGVTTMAVKVAGSDKIAAQSENQISLIAQRKLNGAATRSIDDWVRYVAGSVGYAADDINEDELTALAAIWDARGDYYDYAVVDQTTVKQEIAQALRAGFSELTVDQGKIRPVRDELRTTFESMYTPQNMLAPLQRSFSGYNPDDFNGVDVEFTNAQTWETETVQCRLPGDTGTRVEKFKLEGVTDRTRAWRIGMRERRILKYRRKNFSWSTEWDALNSRYLSYCAVSDDVPGYGQSCLVRSFEAQSEGAILGVSEPLNWIDAETHVAALRRPDGTLFGPSIATRIDDYTLSIADDLDFTPVISGAIEPTHLIFGTIQTWSYPVLVTEISPSGDSVDVSAVAYDSRVYDDDDNEPS